MKAERVAYIKEKFGDDRIIEISIWQIPKDKDRPHGYKYRLHYGYTDGTCIIRYDNEKGKGNHRHRGDKEEPYTFISLRKLHEDFEADVKSHIRKKRNE